MPIRNPFKRSAQPVIVVEPTPAATGFQDANVTGQKAVETEPTEYQLSEIDDSGVFLPPSPPETASSFWSRTNSTTLTHRSTLTDSEPFTISRESFDSYRRSFDISARSPISATFEFEQPPRQSLDSRVYLTRPVRVRHEHSMEWPREDDSEEGDFEDVVLNEEKKLQSAPTEKKRSLFARLTDSSEKGPKEPKASNHHSLFAGRKRAQSGQGSELNSMPRPIAPAPIKVDLDEE